MSINHVYNQTVADGTATSLVRPSDWNSNHNLIYNLSGNTLGSSQISGLDITLVGDNLSLSADTAGGKLHFSVPSTSQLSGQANITIGTTGSTIGFSAVDGIQALIAGTQTYNQIGTVSFINSNGVSWGLNSGASSSNFTASINSTSAMGLNTAGTNMTWTANSSGLSINAAGYAGTTTAITGRASITLNSLGLQFNGSGLAGTNTATTGNISVTINSSGISLNAVGMTTTGTGSSNTRAVIGSAAASNAGYIKMLIGTLNVFVPYYTTN